MKKTYMYRWLIASLIVFAIPAHSIATIITFDNKASFLSVTGADATAPLPNVGMIPGGSSGSLTVGELTFTITPPSREFFSGTIDRGIHPNPWTPFLPGNQIAISDIENLNVDLASPVYSLGFDFVEEHDIDPWGVHDPAYPYIDSIFTVTLLNNGVFSDSFIFNTPNDVAAFVGVFSDTQFNRIEIRETTGDINNEFFGQFYTGENSLISVPDASVILLLTPALIGLVGFRKRSKR